MAHEEDGMVQEWTSRILLCRHCGLDYVQKRGGDDSCPACGNEQYDWLEDYYD
jgi:rubrerythrin